MRAAATATAAIFVAFVGLAGGQQATTTEVVEIDGNDIGGTVTGSAGPEAGVWVIAETRDLPIRYVKITVTDERGRFVIPDLPDATFSLWVRGYGLTDSPKIKAKPGALLKLRSVDAPSPRAAAQYDPAIYWFSMIRVPGQSKFPRTGAGGNGIPEEFKTQEQWLNLVKTNGCGTCHQLGNYATRTIPPALGTFASSIDAWERRLRSGPGGGAMMQAITRLTGADGGHIAALADWTDRIAAGETPSAVPPRPQGVERNIVVTVRD